LRRGRNTKQVVKQNTKKDSYSKRCRHPMSLHVLQYTIWNVHMLVKSSVAPCQPINHRNRVPALPGTHYGYLNMRASTVGTLVRNHILENVVEGRTVNSHKLPECEEQNKFAAWGTFSHLKPSTASVWSSIFIRCRQIEGLALAWYNPRERGRSKHRMTSNDNHIIIVVRHLWLFYIFIWDHPGFTNKQAPWPMH
jgi:hypothetical protein